MDITIFIVCLCFGLVLTLIGLRNSVVSIFAIVFNLSAFTTALVDGVTAQIFNGTALQNVTYDPFPALVLPALYVCLSVVKLAKYR